MRRKEEGLKK